MSLSRPARSRLKLIALFAIFGLPVAVAWGMVEWRLGVPEGRTAHGTLHPAVPALSHWPVEGVEKAGASDWLLAFDCAEGCAERADQWWRLHRALGREAHRLSRLRLGGTSPALPGEAIAQWSSTPPEWRRPGGLWVLDPDGRVVLGYSAQVAPADVLDDIEQLLRMNPEPPSAWRDDDN